MKTTSTYVNIDAKVMKAFKGVIRNEGYRLQKGIENALKEYVARRGETIYTVNNQDKTGKLRY